MILFYAAPVEGASVVQGVALVLGIVGGEGVAAGEVGQGAHVQVIGRL